MDGRLIRDYSYYLRIERAMSPNTVASYCSDVSAFAVWLGERGPETVCTSDVIGYMESRDDVGKRSLARILSSLKSFFGYLVMEGIVPENPCDAVDSPKLSRHLPQVLSVGEVESIIGSVDTGTWNGLRDRAILEVLYGCGLRVSEAASMRVSDIFFDDGFVRVIGKGDKERLVPIGDIGADAVRQYLASRPEPSEPRYADILFLSRFGKPLSRVYIFRMVKERALAAGIRKEISPHTFRHSFATHLIENGADLRAVQEMLGHESILTTEIYTHMDKSTWQNNILSHHPGRSRGR